MQLPAAGPEKQRNIANTIAQYTQSYPTRLYTVIHGEPIEYPRTTIPPHLCITQACFNALYKQTFL